MTIPTPLPSPTDAAAHYQRLYALYVAGEVVNPLIATKTANETIAAGALVAYAFPAAERVQAWSVGEGGLCGVALAAAEDGQPVKVLMWAMITGERVPPPVNK